MFLVKPIQFSHLRFKNYQVPESQQLAQVSCPSGADFVKLASKSLRGIGSAGLYSIPRVPSVDMSFYAQALFAISCFFDFVVYAPMANHDYLSTYQGRYPVEYCVPAGEYLPKYLST